MADEGKEAHDALVAQLEAEWAAEAAPWEAAANIILDDVIDPERTRDKIAEGIEYAWPAGPRVTSAGR
jgi:acetyl-CoA carboxylase carboxyltransferase component